MHNFTSYFIFKIQFCFPTHMLTYKTRWYFLLHSYQSNIHTNLLVFVTNSFKSVIPIFHILFNFHFMCVFNIPKFNFTSNLCVWISTGVHQFLFFFQVDINIFCLYQVAIGKLLKWGIARKGLSWCLRSIIGTSPTSLKLFPLNFTPTNLYSMATDGTLFKFCLLISLLTMFFFCLF